MTPPRIDRATFDSVRETFGHVASWAVWSEPGGRRPGEWVSDLSALDVASDPARLEPLHADVVLIALNSGVREDGSHHGGPLAMYHHPHGRDFMLAEAIRETPIWGAYLTDFFKGIPTRDGSGLRDFLLEHPVKVSEDVATLRAELALIGARDPLLVCLGTQVEPFVRKHFGAVYDVVRVSHYSRAMTKESYRAEFQSLAPLMNKTDRT